MVAGVGNNLVYDQQKTNILPETVLAGLPNGAWKLIQIGRSLLAGASFEDRRWSRKRFIISESTGDALKLKRNCRFSGIDQVPDIVVISTVYFPDAWTQSATIFWTVLRTKTIYSMCNPALGKVEPICHALQISSKKTCHHVSLELSNAFDDTWHNHLLSKMFTVFDYSLWWRVFIGDAPLAWKLGIIYLTGEASWSTDLRPQLS